MIDQNNLNPFIAALRETSRAAPADPTTGPRIVETLRARRRKSRRRLRAVALALVGLPLGVSAFALWSGAPERVWTWLDPRAPVSARRQVRAVEPRHEAPAVVAIEAAPSAAAPADAGLVPQPMAAAPAAEVSTAPVIARKARATTQQPSAAAQAAAALYDAAHRWHFTEHDYSAALAAWDRYLSQAPAPVLHVEAHYNRAMCLLRLGRYEDAVQALNPFAAGIYGSYRQREARALIRGIEHKLEYQ